MRQGLLHASFSGLGATPRSFAQPHGPNGLGTNNRIQSKGQRGCDFLKCGRVAPQLGVILIANRPYFFVSFREPSRAFTSRGATRPNLLTASTARPFVSSQPRRFTNGRTFGPWRSFRLTPARWARLGKLVGRWSGRAENSQLLKPQEASTHDVLKSERRSKNEAQARVYGLKGWVGQVDALEWVLLSLFAKCWMTRLTAAARLDAVNF